MSITKKDVEHIADLARIELSDQEKEKFTTELSAILEFVEKLNEVDTKEVSPMSGGTSLQNIMRPDGQSDRNLEEKSPELLLAFPEKKEGWLKVKAVFEF